MKTEEIIRVIVLSLVGAIFMFVIQPFIYIQGWIWQPDVPTPEAALEAWTDGDYMSAAMFIFGISVLSTIFWCVVTTKSKAHRANDLQRWSLCWWILGLVPILSIGIAIGLLNSVEEVRLSLAIFFVIDILWIFWLTTATSTPGLLMYTPPLALQIRELLGLFSK